MGDLYVVPTPIGNLEDITIRALHILRSVSLIAAEDTRHSRKLLTHYDIHTRLTSYHEHNKQSKTGALLDFLASGDVAIITDAGTPGISDPGYELIAGAIDAGVRVIALPGANAITTSLSASGLPTDSFRFYGFPPRKDSELRQFLQEKADFRETLVFYESPNRLIKTLAIMRDVWGERQAVVGLEVTKLFEEFARGTLGELVEHFSREPIRGEVTVMIQGK
ncbi:MAG: 16S rRNA (cytidine(1402)-2'-O)-methyltransferase [Anaerolineae bacterium]|nr:16S rRNA (cytidine(1402)-2'-O)-methyltransferase [Anaerolineae bacterium]